MFFFSFPFEDDKHLLSQKPLPKGAKLRYFLLHQL